MQQSDASTTLQTWTVGTATGRAECLRRFLIRPYERSRHHLQHPGRKSGRPASTRQSSDIAFWKTNQGSNVNPEAPITYFKLSQQAEEDCGVLGYQNSGNHILVCDSTKSANLLESNSIAGPYTESDYTVHVLEDIKSQNNESVYDVNTITMNEEDIENIASSYNTRNLKPVIQTPIVQYIYQYLSLQQTI